MMPRHIWFHVVAICSLWLFPLTRAADPSDPCCPGENILTDTGCQLKNDMPMLGYRSTLLHCDEGTFILNPKMSTVDNFSLNYEGELVIASTVDDFAVIEKGKFCLTNMKIDTSLDTVALVCFTNDGRVWKYLLNASLTVLSIVFLLLTIGVYIIVHELRDIYGKCIVCTCSSLALGFFFLAIANLFRINISELCTANGYLMYYWILCSFFWMNVLSINVWKSVVYWNVYIAEKKQFLAFVSYGWGMPLLLLVVSVITNHVDGDHIKPGIGVNSCWFKEKVATWIYFYGPIGILLGINLILFVWTSRRLWNKTNYSNMTMVKALKFKFFLHFKVFFVMGIAWIFELISYIHGNDGFILWMVTDIFNCLQGVFLFFVLVLFRKKALRGLNERGLLCGFLPSRWASGPDEECEEIMVAMVENDPAASPITA